MQSQGDLLRMKVHAHNTVFDQVRNCNVSLLVLFLLLFCLVRQNYR